MQSFDNCNFLKDVPNLKWLDLNHSRVKDYRFLHHQLQSKEYHF
jgi:hypothetical protein